VLGRRRVHQRHRGAGRRRHGRPPHHLTVSASRAGV
jgi:hypothetical protein